MEALRAEYKLCEILPVVGMAKSSCEYAGNARTKGETEGRAAARKAVVEAFGAGGGTPQITTVLNQTRIKHQQSRNVAPSSIIK